MKPLEPRTQQHIIDLLTPLMASEQERRSLLILTLFDHPILNQLDFTGSTLTFLPTMIDKLYQFGKLDDGRPVLWALLEEVRDQVGLEGKHIIDALSPAFDLPLAPQLDRVFISYSRKNERDAQRIVSDLNDAGLRVWYDREKIKGGEDWWQSIVRGIANADYFIFCLSPDSIRSKVARDELLAARQYKKPIFAVMLQECIAELNDEVFAEIDWLPKLHIISFTQPEHYGHRLRELIQSLPGYTAPDSYFIDQYDSRDLPNPFRGLEAFLEVNAAYFAGREDAVQELLARLQSTDKPRLLAVVGASGSGKSSLVRAGLIPALRQARPFWQTLTIKPGSDPIEELADRLQERLGAMAEHTRDRLREQTSSLDDIAAELLAGKDEARLVLVIDQFEELFTLTSKADCQTFLSLLLYAVNKPHGKVQVILTLRSDFFDRLSAVPDLARLVRENLDIATEMTPDQLRRSIENPARKVGVSYEQDLVEKILEDVRSQPGSLPLLQFALRELFERKLGRRMTHDAYEELGGVKGALATRAETLYSALSLAQQNALRRVLLRLVEVGDETVTRRRVAQTDLVFTGIPNTIVKGILDQLTDANARLLVVSAPVDDDNPSNDDQIFYEVSHEALLTHWKRLADWITENRDDLRRSSEILDLSKQWDSTKRLEASYLLSGGRLITAREWLLRGDPIQLQRDFVEASTTYSEQRQRHEIELQRRALNRARQLAAGFGIFLVVALGLAVYALDQRNQSLLTANGLATQVIRADNSVATAERRAVESGSLALAAEAQVQEQEDVQLALALALEANAVPNPPLLAQAVLSKLAYQGGNLILERVGGQGTITDSVSAAVFSPGGRFLATGTASGRLRIWDANTYTLLYELQGTETEIKALSFSPDGRLILAGGGEQIGELGDLRLWDIEAGRSVTLNGHNAQVSSVGFMPDGITAFSGDQMGHIFVWDVAEAEQIRRLPPHDVITNPVILINPDGTLIYRVMDKGVETWDWKSDTDVTRTSLKIGSSCDVAAVHPDGKRLLCGDRFTAITGLFLADLETGKQLKSYQSATESIYTLAFNADGSRFATGQAQLLRLWETESGNILHSYNSDINLVVVAFNGDGSQVVTETSGGKFGVWDTRLINRAILDETLLTRDDLPLNGFMSALVYLPSGDTLLEADAEGVYALDMQTNKPYRRIGVKAGVSSLALLPNEDILIGTSEGDLIRHSLTSEQPVWSIKAHSQPLASIAVSHDGLMILTGGVDGFVRLWDADSGTQIDTFEVVVPYGVRGVSFTADGDVAALGCISVSIGNDKKYTCAKREVQVWDLSTGVERYRLPSDMDTWAVSPDGQFLVVVNESDQLEMYESTTGTLMRRFVRHKNIQGDIKITFSSDGTRLLSGGLEDGLIIEWDVSSGQPLREVDTNMRIWRLAFAPHNREFVTVSQIGDASDYLLLRWRLDDTIDALVQWTQNNHAGYTFSCGDRVRYDLSPTCDASGLAPSQTPFPSTTPSPTLDRTQTTLTPSRTPSRTPTVTPTATPTITPTPKPTIAGPQYGELDAVEWSPDSSKLLAASADGEIIIWNSLTGEEIYRFEGSQGQWSPDNTRIATWGQDYNVRVWSLLSGLLTYTLEGHTDTIQQVRWSTDSGRLITISRDGTAHVWDTLIGKALTIDTGNGLPPLTDWQWSPNNTYMMTSARDGSIRLWEASTGRLLRILTEDALPDTAAPIDSLVWSLDSTRLLASSVGSVSVWNVTTGELLHTLDTASQSPILGAVWSPNGMFVLLRLADQPPTLWNVNTGESIATLDILTYRVVQAFWQLEGTQQLITISIDGTLRFWDGTTGTLLRTIETHEPLSSAQLSPDGSLFATTSPNGTLRLWDVRSGREQLFIFPALLPTYK